MIAGVDGCKGGWIACCEREGRVWFEQHTHLINLLRAYNDIAMVAIDMIIGLPSVAQKGGRAADKAARQKLGKRAASVFSAPCRAAVYAENYPDSLRASRESGPDGVGLSKQTFHLFPKVKEVDELLRQHPEWRVRMLEVHPELSFWEMNGRREVPSKHDPAGKKKRVCLLRQQGIRSDASSLHKDHLDAGACLWSARRVVAGQHCFVPAVTDLDSVGLAMRIAW